MKKWKKFNVPEKEEFYRNLNMEGTTGTDYMHMRRVLKDFELKNPGEYHELYLKSDTLLLDDVFKNFKKNVSKNLLFRSCKIFFSSWITMASSFKKHGSIIRIIN